MLIFDHHFQDVQNPNSYWLCALKVCNLDQEEKVFHRDTNALIIIGET